MLSRPLGPATRFPCVDLDSPISGGAWVTLVKGRRKDVPPKKLSICSAGRVMPLGWWQRDVKPEHVVYVEQRNRDEEPKDA